MRLRTPHASSSRPPFLFNQHILNRFRGPSTVTLAASECSIHLALKLARDIRYPPSTVVRRGAKGIGADFEPFRCPLRQDVEIHQVKPIGRNVAQVSRADEQFPCNFVYPRAGGFVDFNEGGRAPLLGCASLFSSLGHDPPVARRSGMRPTGPSTLCAGVRPYRPGAPQQDRAHARSNAPARSSLRWYRPPDCKCRQRRPCVLTRGLS